MYGWTVDEAMEWENTWRVGQETPTGDQMAMDVLANEVLRLREGTKRFALFAGETCYPIGGINDLVGRYATVQNAVALCDLMIRENGIVTWAHVVDLDDWTMAVEYHDGRWWENENAK